MGSLAIIVGIKDKTNTSTFLFFLDVSFRVHSLIRFIFTLNTFKSFVLCENNIVMSSCTLRELIALVVQAGQFVMEQPSPQRSVLLGDATVGCCCSSATIISGFVSCNRSSSSLLFVIVLLLL